MVTAENPAVQPLPEIPSAPSSGRVQSVDALRGAIMILMAVDHVRDFINRSAMSFSPTDLTRTTTALFLTRWITHFCAPVFAFTAGIGAFFWLRHGRTKAQLSRFLLSRGLWLVILELTVVRFLFVFEIRFKDRLVFLLVFWMLGLCMMILAALVHLPTRVLAVLSLVVIAGHNLLDPIAAARFGGAAGIWNILHQPGLVPFLGARFLTPYSLIPWFAVMAAGYCFGAVFLWEPGRRKRFLVRLGCALTIAFVLLRAWNIYGDPVPWSVQPSAVFTALSFLNCTKYPPSLDFLLMTLGPAIAALAWLEHVRFSPHNPLIVFGRVPFFYFVTHIALIHLVAVALAFIRYGAHGFLLMPAPSMGGPAQIFPSDYGFSLWVVYPVWLGVVAALYPLCRWFADLKQRRRSWWLSYL
jgi:uncharacterized membrane protein